MRSLVALILLGVASIGVSAQPAKDFRVSIVQGGGERAAVWDLPTTPYQAGGNKSWAGVPALPATDTAPAPSARSFRIQAWNEDGKARVVVYAVTLDGAWPTGQREMHLATFLLEDGASRSVLETAKYQAAPITVLAKRVPAVTK